MSKPSTTSPGTHSQALDDYSRWYRNDPREQVAHAFHHFAGALARVHEGNFAAARFSHEDAVQWHSDTVRLGVGP